MLKKFDAQLLAFALLFFLFPAAYSKADTWKLPLTIDSKNTSANFEVDSTWHLIHGSAVGASGIIQLSDPTNSQSISGVLEFPVAKFDTNDNSRDETLRDIMAEKIYPNVTVKIIKLSDNCTPQFLDAEWSCNGYLESTMSIRDVTKEIKLPVKITKDKDWYRVDGEFFLNWADYHVEDPSILIAKVDPTVKITFQMLVPILFETSKPQ